ncbi:CRISPR-associated endonuclease Cas1 [Infirmifilum uzonense]|uniref:CRISPR-associated endonuclease Cas1 n=2 Tax=Infirmifilum TaxID=2856573 RepID=UPI00069B65FD|nr:CRISPR-associated endonuclease Cas1 [Infirmifilum uzonense]
MSLGRMILLDKHGAMLAARGGEFEIRVREENQWKVMARYPVANITAIVLAVEGVTITGGAIRLAAEHGIDINFMPGWEPTARLVPATYGGSLELWLKQVKQARSEKRRTELAKSFVGAKIHNQKTVIKSYLKSEAISGRDTTELQRKLKTIEKAESQLPGTDSWKKARVVEAVAAQAYWEAIANLLPKQVGFKKRLKRWDIKPGVKLDPFNIALNIGYTYLLRETWKAVFAVGLNPYFGFLHARRPGRMSLVLDLMEEFRPIAVDRPLIRLARSDPSRLEPLTHEAGEAKDKAAREVWRHIAEYARTTKPPIPNLILIQARKLARALRDNAPYMPFKAKW